MTSSVVPGRLRQLVVVLSVLAGLFGMHGLMSGHGVMASPQNVVMATMSGPSTEASSVRTAEAPGNAPAETASAAADIAVHTQAALPLVTEAVAGALSLSAPGPAMTGLLLTCLAILPGGLLLGLLLLRLRRRPLPFQRRHPGPPTSSRPGTRAHRLPPPPDLVAGLCVSRT